MELSDRLLLGVLWGVGVALSVVVYLWCNSLHHPLGPFDYWSVPIVGIIALGWALWIGREPKEPLPELLSREDDRPDGEH